MVSRKIIKNQIQITELQYLICQVVFPLAQEAAECHIEGILIDSEPIPTTKDIEVHKNNPDYKDGIWAL